MTGHIEYQVFQNHPNILCKSLWQNHDSYQSKESAGADKNLDYDLLNKSNFSANVLVYANQVHGNLVERAKKSGVVDHCDGLITTQQKMPLLIKTADCASVMIYSPVQKSIANLHVGWRGAFAGVIAAGIKKLSQQETGPIKEMVVAVSPMIGGCCYEVGEEFYDSFENKYLERRHSKIFFHLKRIIDDQLLTAGILSNHIEYSKECTHCSHKGLPSYRKNKTQNRLKNVIEMKGH
jgi:YfiH family protein